MTQVADCVCVLLTCDTCHTVGLRNLSDQNGLFLPVGKVTDEGCKSEAHHLLTSVCEGKDSFSDPVAFSEMSAQVDKQGVFYQRTIFSSHLKNGFCCKQIKSLTWIKLSQIIHSVDSMWGPEPVILSMLMTQARHGKHQKQTLFPRLIENRMISNIQDFLPRGIEPGQKPDLKRALAAAAGFTKDHLKNLFQEFFTHAFPSQFWTWQAFRSYAKQAGWPFPRQEDMERLYRSFLPYGQLYLTFDDFVLGLGALIPSTRHGGRTGFVRMQRIFRFYDDRRAKHLSHGSMYKMRRDILISKGAKHDHHAVEEALVDDYAALKLEVHGKKTQPVDELMLLHAFASLNHKGLRGFSTLYRMNYDLNAKRIYTTKKLIDSNRCDRHKQVKTDFAFHQIVIDKHGKCKDNRMTEIDRSLIVSEKNKSRQNLDKHHISHRIIRLVHEMADRIRIKLPQGLGNHTCTYYDNSHDWTKVPENVRTSRMDLIKQMLSLARKMFANESRIPKVTSPCIVFGDIHGNLSDLLQYEKQFWPRFPFDQMNVVFLGDFVDRGKQSVEVYLYLIAMKYLCPSRVTLLRGNHEMRPLQRQYGFYKECCHKFDRQGSHMWEEFNRVMDCMPVAGLIDEQLFCCHGGIPLTEPRISNLMKMPVPLPNPAETFPAAWEVLWSDPVETKDMSDMRMTIGSANSELESSFGSFIPNVKRSTGHFFDAGAVNRFNLLNGTSHLLRAHEQQMYGYKISLDGVCVTVFSASAYSKMENTSAVLLIHDGLITPCQITT